MLRNLVRRTGFASLTPQHVESLMMKHARKTKHKYGETIYIISRSQFGKFIREIIPKESSKHFDNVDVVVICLWFYELIAIDAGVLIQSVIMYR